MIRSASPRLRAYNKNEEETTSPSLECHSIPFEHTRYLFTALSFNFPVLISPITDEISVVLTLVLHVDSHIPC